MDTEKLRLLLESIEQISTEIFFLWIMNIMTDFVLSMTYYIILMIFAYKLFALFGAHLTAKRMADRLGYFWPYSDREKRHMVRIFERGLEREHANGYDPERVHRAA